MAKRGRKKISDLSEEKQNAYYKKKFQEYSKKYDALKAQGVEMDTKYTSVKAFAIDFEQYRQDKTTKKNPMRALIEDSRLYSVEQAKSWAKAGSRTGVFDNYKSAYKEIRSGGENAKAFFELYNELLQQGVKKQKAFRSVLYLED